VAAAVGIHNLQPQAVQVAVAVTQVALHRRQVEQVIRLAHLHLKEIMVVREQMQVQVCHQLTAAAAAAAQVE
jgi:Mg2+/Co2+ transporter CorC